jgi:hypothetical protein
MELAQTQPEPKDTHKEILAQTIELYVPIEVISRQTRYMVGRQFSKLFYDRELHSWCAVSRASGGTAVIGQANIKAIILDDGNAKPAAPDQVAPPKPNLRALRSSGPAPRTVSRAAGQG